MQLQTRILSIEDDPQMSGLLQLILERQGHHVISVKSGEFGLEMLRSIQPDVLLLDLMLPDIDGWEIYRQMKSDDELADMPVIIVSARNAEEDARQGYTIVGNDRFVQKPFEVSELIEAVEQALNQRKMEA